MRKDILSLVLSASLVCSMLPVDGWAPLASAAQQNDAVKTVKTLDDADESEEDEVTASGTFGGDEFTEATHEWSFVEGTGVLTISGTGAMPDYTKTDYTGAPWYAYADAIRKVVFTGDVTTVSAYAFYQDYTALTEVDLSGAKDLTTVGEYAFAGTSSKISPLATVTGMEQLTNVGKYSFGYTSLTEVSLPGVTTLTGAFENCTDLVSVSLPNLTDCLTWTFDGCASLTRVEAPVLNSIGNYAFRNCTSLETISLPKLTQLAGYCFQNCTSLKNVDLPELTTISANYAFSGCTGLKSISLPSLQNATNAQYTFSKCTSLESADLPELTSMMNYGFQNCSALMEVNIPKLGAINSGTFTGCSSLVYVYAPVASLNSSAFSGGVPSLQRLYVGQPGSATNPSGITADIYTTDTMNRFSQYTAGQVTNVEDVADLEALAAKENALRITMEDYDVEGTPAEPQVTKNTRNAAVTFEYYTDSACTILVNEEDAGQKPTAPGTYYARARGAAAEGDVEDADYYFATTSNIVPFIIYGEVAGDGYTYNNKTHVLTITDASVMDNDRVTASSVPWNSLRGEITAVKVQEGVTLTRIAKFAFQDMNLATELPLPETVTEVAGYAYKGCSSWEGEDVVTSNITTLGDRAFSGCTALKGTAVLGEGITEVPASVFYQCSSLTEIRFSSTIESIGSTAFYGCQALEEIDMKDSKVTELPANCFTACTSLSDITLPQNLQTIGSRAFAQCNALETLEIPASVTTLGSYAFYSCTGLKYMIIPATVTQIDGGLFQMCSSLSYVEFEKTDYTEETLVKVQESTMVGGVTVTYETMFDRTSGDIVVLCNGDTYDLLRSYALKGEMKVCGWEAEIVQKPDSYLADLKDAYDAEKALVAELQETDYDAALWTAFQTAVADADAQMEQGETNYEKASSRIAAKAGLVTAFLPLLQGTYDKVGDLVLSDYDTEADTWYDYLDAIDDTKMLLSSESYTLAQLIDCEAVLRQALEGLTLLPTDDAKTELESIIADATDGINEEEYTQESWNALQDAIAEAREIAKTGSISQIKAAQEKVAAAAEALVKKQVEPSPSPSASPIPSPSVAPSPVPTQKPVVQPTQKPVVQPTQKPVVQPTQKPTVKVTVKKAVISKVKSSKKKNLTIQWKKVASVTGYQIQIGLNKKFTKGKKSYTVKKAKTIKKTIKKLKSKKKYYVRIRAYKTVSGKKYYGTWSKVKSAKVK